MTTLNRKSLLLSAACCFTLFLLSFLFYKYDIEPEQNLSFSVSPGFYEEPFSLELLSQYDHPIYYTLDGSEPTDSSLRYTSPIPIFDLTSQANIHAARTDVSTGFLPEKIEAMVAQMPDIPQDDPGYTVPDYPVDKCTIVRASVIVNGECLDSITGSYFLNYSDRPAFRDIMVMSVVTPSENLFDYETGIYVTGKRFTDAIPILGESTSPLWNWWPANYRSSGREWERDAHVSIFDENRSLILSSNCGLRVQGSGSRGFLPRNLGFVARTPLTGREFFDFSLFGEQVQPHRFWAFSGGDEYIFKLTDYLANSLGNELAYGTMQFFPCALFLDGEYWGTYYITENYNSKFLSDHYGIPSNDAILIKNSKVAEGEPHDMELFQELTDFVLENDMTLAANYQRLLSKMDMESYIDYYATQIYIARYGDWPAANWAVWRSRSQNPDNPYQDGRWRWLFFDANSGAMRQDMADTDSLARIIQEDDVFAAISRNESFRQAYVQRLRSLSQETFSPEKCDAFIDAYLQTMLEPLAASAKRFQGSEMRKEIIENAQAVRSFFHQRVSYIDTMIAENWGEGY